MRGFIRLVLIPIAMAMAGQPGPIRAQAEGETDPEIAVSELEVTADGLHRVDPSLMAGAWLKPDADLSLYTRAFVMPTIVLSREMDPPSSSAWADSSRSVFPVSELMQDRLRETFGEAFHNAMSAQRSYEIADELGRDVLLVQAYLTDVATGLPPDLAGANVNAIRWAWEANLIVELRDSMSNEIIARLRNRNRIEGPVDADMLWGLAPQITRMWSRAMVGQLDELTDFYPSRLWRRYQQAQRAND